MKHILKLEVLEIMYGLLWMSVKNHQVSNTRAVDPCILVMKMVFDRCKSFTNKNSLFKLHKSKSNKYYQNQYKS